MVKWGVGLGGGRESCVSFPSPGVAEEIGGVPVEITGCSGRVATSAQQITQGEIVTSHECSTFNQGVVSTKILKL